MPEIIKPKWPKRLVIARHGQSEQNVVLDLLEDRLQEKLDEIKIPTAPKGRGINLVGIFNVADTTDQYPQQMKKIRDTDIKLTETGKWQAIETGKYLAKTSQFDICFSSPYLRTLQTSEEICSQLGYNLRIFKDNRLREKEFGRLHGMTTEEIKEKHPEEYL